MDKAPSAWAEELACRWVGKVPVPQHRCLLPAQLPLAARAPEQELGPLCSLPPWGRLCRGQLPALSMPCIQAASWPPPMGTPLPACRGNVSLASSRVRWLAPAVPRPTGPPTHQSAVAAPCTPRRVPVESSSPGEPCPARPPWGGWGVSLPSCGTEERGRSGEGGGFGKMPWCHGAAGGGRERCGLRSGAPRRLRAPALSRHCPAGHCGLGAAAAFITCSAVGCHKGPHCDPPPGRGGGGRASPGEARDRLIPGHGGALMVPPGPTLPSCLRGTSLSPSGVCPCSDTPARPQDFPVLLAHCRALPLPLHDIKCVRFTQALQKVTSTLVYLPAKRKTSCRKEEKGNETSSTQIALLGFGSSQK